jgi:cytochrome c-type biogenesis protein CcmE
MQRLIVWVLFAILLGSCGQSNKKEGTTAEASQTEEVVKATIQELLAQPADYDGKEVAISGMVTHVCKHGGQKCFVLADDGETQIRIVPAGDIDEFKIDLEGSTVAFKGTFKVLNPVQAEEHVAEHDSKEHHETEMSHSPAEKADYFIEAIDFKELTQ